jgi:hypothetical protein
MNTDIHTHGPWLELSNIDALIPIAGIAVGGLVLITLVCGLVCIGFVKALRGGGATRVKRKVDRDEALAFQQLERGFRRMEERIDSLETLLIDRMQPTATDREFR